MSLEIKNTSDIITADNFRWKVLIYSLPGCGKTLWASGATNPGIAACETGSGKGLLTIADRGLPFVEPATVADFEAFCSGQIFKDKDTLIVDSLSDMVKTFVKDYALTIPRSRGESPKRRAGVPELDDYGVMGEVTRRLLRKLLNLDKHIVVTATMRIDKPDAEAGGEIIIGPDLPGQMFLGSTAMFDTVMALRTRPMLRDPKDAKSRYTERYLISQPEGALIAKCRSNVAGQPLLAREEVFDPATGRGTWPDLYGKILKGYSQAEKKS